MEITEKDLGIFIKVGRKYKKLNPSEMYFLYEIGRPRNGIWRIDENTATWLGDLVSPERIRVQELKKSLMDGLVKAEDLRMRGTGLSRLDIVKILMEEIALYHKKDEEEAHKDEGKSRKR